MAAALAGVISDLHCLAVPNIGIDLGRAEKVIWTGAPKQGLLLRGADALMIPFTLLWTGAVLAAFLAPPRPPGQGTFVLFPMVLFLLVGLYITVGRFGVDMLARGRTTYAVTSERVLIQSGIFNQTVKSLNLRTLSDVTMSERRNGSGTITFGPGSPWGAWGSRMRWPGMPQQPMFEGIPDVRTVYNLISDAQRAVSGGAS